MSQKIRFGYFQDCVELSQMSGQPPEYFSDFLQNGRMLIADDGYIMYEIIPNGCRIQKIFQKPESKIAKDLITKVEEETIESGDWHVEITIDETDLETALLLKSLNYIGKLAGKHYLFQKNV